MKSVPLLLAFVLAPLACLAQPVQLQVRCMDPARQEEVLGKARAIAEDIARRRDEADKGVDYYGALRLRDERNAAFLACAGGAREAGRPPGEACAGELLQLRAAAELVQELAADRTRRIRPLEREERLRLEALRAEYPDCEGAVAALP